jgi:dCTP deaminase
MSILCDWQIAEQSRAGMVTPFDPELVNPASLDVRLGQFIRIESAQSPELVLVDLELWRDRQGPYMLKPGQFILAETMETFYLPDFIAAQFMLKSSRAREGLEHLMAGYCDPGWHGSKLTLELHNSRQLHPVAIWPGMKIGQMVFHLMDQRPTRSYAVTGRYNNDATVQGSRG